MAEDANLGGVAVFITKANGEVATYNGTKIYTSEEAVAINVKFSRSQMPAGKTLEVQFSGPLALKQGAATLPAEVALFVESASVSGGTLSVKFKSAEEIAKVDPTIGQVLLGLTGNLSSTGNSSQQTISWTVAQQSDSSVVILTKPGDSPRPENFKASSSKSGSFSGFNKYTVTDGKVVLGDEWIGQTASYKLTISTVAGYSGNLTDVVDAPLTPLAGSFSGKIITWDANGLNRVETPYADTPTIDGRTSTIPVNLPANSTLELDYKASIATAADRDALQAEFQKQYEKIVPAQGGSLSIRPDNTVTAGGDIPSAKANVQIAVNVPAVVGPKVPQFKENAFGKSVSPGWVIYDVEDMAAQVAANPIPVTYTLTANLKDLVSEGTAEQPLTLEHNVIVSDTLPSTTRWLTGDGFVKGSGMDFVVADSSVTCDVDTMIGEAQVGTYCVSGQTFIANVGRDTTKNVSLTLKAEIFNIDGLKHGNNNSDWRTKSPSQVWTVINNAAFRYNEKNVNRGANFEIVNVPDYEGLNNTAFTKSVAKIVQPSSVAPAKAGSVTYRFEIRGNELQSNKSMEGVQILDQLNTEVFDISRSEEILASIIGWNRWRDDGVRISNGTGLQVY